jgi:hypothetical protein
MTATAGDDLYVIVKVETTSASLGGIEHTHLGHMTVYIHATA